MSLPSGSTLPNSCVIGDKFLLTVSNVVYVCSATNVWTPTAGVAAWGNIIGTLADQADVSAAIAGAGGGISDGDKGDIVVSGTGTVWTVDPVTGSGSFVRATSPAITTPTGIVKGDVGLGNVDNTTDANKPVSTATQTALNLKANSANPTVAGVTIADASDVTIGGTTGSKIGQSGSKIGFYGVTPAVRPSALTQTYSTASSTHAAVTQLAAPAGGTGVAAGGWSSAANRDLAIASINAARTDIANLKNFVNQIVDQLQALGLLQ